MAIIVPIVSQWNPKGINQATKSITSFDGITKKLGGTLATVFAAKQVVSFFAASVRGAMEDQKAQIQLERSIRNTTNATSAQISGLSSFIRETQFSTGVLDDQLRPALNRLVLATGDVEQSQKLLSLALDISAGTGKDLESVTSALSKAAGGQFTALQRLGVGLSKTVLETKDLDTITGVLATKFSGQAAAAAQTFGGQMNILNSYFQEAKEIIGGGFIQALESFTNPGGAAALVGEGLLKVADYVADVIVGIATLINQFRDFGKRLEQEYPSINRWVEALGNVIGLFGEFIKRFTVIGIIADVGNETRNLAATNKLAGDRYQLLAEKVYGYKSATSNLVPTIERTKKATKGLTDAQKALINANIKVQESVVNNLENSLSKAESALDSVKGKFDDLKNTISGSVTDVIDFGAAIEKNDFLQALTAQAEDATTFANKIKKLIQLGLSERGIREVLESGLQAGSLIADQIIAGGATVVNQVNTLLKAVDTVANTVGELGAKTFYQQGITQGEALVAGIKFALEAARLELDRLRASLTAPVTVPKTSTNTTGTNIRNTGKISTVLPPDESGRYGLGRFSRLAKGGIVMGPTNALIGEAGPEAVVPLTGKTSKMMGATYNITVNAGMGTNGAFVGKQIVEAIKKYEKTSGQVFAGA